MPGATIYGQPARGPEPDRVGVIPFNLATADHALVAAVLGHEGGIGVRNGCFCAQIYVGHLLGLRRHRGDDVRATDAIRPGMVRISLGAYNTRDDIDAAVAMLSRVAGNRLACRYQRTPDGEYAPL